MCGTATRWQLQEAGFKAAEYICILKEKKIIKSQ